MARFPRSTPRSSTTSGLGSRGPLSLALLGEAALVLRDHWRAIPPADRARLADLLRQSKGRPMQLTPQQRAEIGRIVKRADLPGLTRDLAPIASRRSARRGPRLRQG